MVNILRKHKYQIILWFFVLAYIVYFSSFTILRYKALYASYYDLGIMHQTVYNTYMAIKTGDWSRFLELTNPVGSDQIKRIAIHNDLLLAVIAPFYFIHSGPETLLVIQTVVLALGALAIFKIARVVLGRLGKSGNNYFLPIVFSISYLFYPPLQRANIYDFHTVTLTTTFLLLMFYFWLVKKYWLSFLFFILSLLTKEQVALTTMMFGIYIFLIFNYQFSILNEFSIFNQAQNLKLKKDRKKIFSIAIVVISIFWFILSVFYLIPLFRGGHHFAVERYSDFGNTPIRIIIGTVLNPYSVFKYLLRLDVLRYLFFLLGPVGFLSIFSPFQLLIALPEFLLNLLSKNSNMYSIFYHYTAAITPFVFISAIYGGKKLLSMSFLTRFGICLFLVCFSVIFAYLKGPLPFSREAEIHPFKYPQKEAKDAAFWAKTLSDEKLKISTTGQLAPFFTSRRYFYIFSARYPLADYVIVRANEIYIYPEKNELIPVYEKLQKDANYQLIYKKENFEVYKRKRTQISQI